MFSPGSGQQEPRGGCAALLLLEQQSLSLVTPEGSTCPQPAPILHAVREEKAGTELGARSGGWGLVAVPGAQPGRCKFSQGQNFLSLPPSLIYSLLAHPHARSAGLCVAELCPSLPGPSAAGAAAAPCSPDRGVVGGCSVGPCPPPGLMPCSQGGFLFSGQLPRGKFCLL